MSNKPLQAIKQQLDIVPIVWNEIRERNTEFFKLTTESAKGNVSFAAVNRQQEIIETKELFSYLFPVDAFIEWRTKKVKAIAYIWHS